MEALAAIVAIIIGLVGFDFAALHWGVDSGELGRDQGRRWSIV